MAIPVKKKANRKYVSFNFRKKTISLEKDSKKEILEKQKEIEKWLKFHQIKKIPPIILM